MTFTTHNENQVFKALKAPGSSYKNMEFIGCRFTRCDLSEALFDACVFRDCRFEDCNLNLARLEACTLSGIEFERCQLLGINWSDGCEDQSLLAKPNGYTGCVLNHGVFMGCKLIGTRLDDCVAHEVDFSDADLTGADCRGTDFAGSRFSNTNLTQADFKGAFNYSISAQHNRLKATRFSLPEAMSLLHSLDIMLDEE